MSLSSIFSKNKGYKRRLDDYEVIQGKVVRQDFTFYDLEFNITLTKKYDWKSISVFLDVSDSTQNVDIPMNNVISIQDDVTVIHLFLKENINRYFFDFYKDYKILIEINEDKIYKVEDIPLVRIVSSINENQAEISPYMKQENLIYYENSFELSITKGKESAKYIRFIYIQSNTSSSNQYSEILPLKDGKISLKKDGIVGTKIKIIMYDENLSIIFMSDELFVISKFNLASNLNRNIYIKYNSEEHLFIANLKSLLSLEVIYGVTQAKFVNTKKNEVIQLNFEKGDFYNKTFSVKKQINNLPSGIYQLYVTMGGKENVELDKKIIILDELNDLFDLQLSRIHTCNYYRAPQIYHLSSNIGNMSEETVLSFSQNGVNFYRGVFQRDGSSNYRILNIDQKSIIPGPFKLNFYEYVSNQYYYEMILHFTNMSFDCGNDQCGFCKDTHEIFTTSLSLKNVECDASELNYTFYNNKKNHTINPSCSYDAANKKLNCNWDECVGGVYDIYVEGIKVDHFISYCEKYECPKVYLPEHVEISKNNPIGILFSNATLRQIEHFRTTVIKESNLLKCQKYYNPNTGHNSIYESFNYDSGIQSTATSIEAFIELTDKNIEHTLTKFILDDYSFIDMKNCGDDETVVLRYNIPCLYNIIIKKQQELTIVWSNQYTYTEFNGKLMYKTRLPQIERQYSEPQKLECSQLNGLESTCKFNTANIDGPRYMIVGYSNKFYSAQRSSLISYTTNVDNCQELLPNKVLTPVIVTLNPPESVFTLDINAYFVYNNQIIPRVKDKNYVYKNYEFTFEIENNGNLKPGEYSVKFEYSCPKSYTFSVKNQLTNSYDTDFVLRPYIKLEQVLEGFDEFYTTESNNQILKIKVSSDIDDIPTLIFKQNNYTYTLDSRFGEYVKQDKLLIYNVNLYEKRNELIDGPYSIYYKSKCLNDPNVDTGLTVIFKYNIIQSVNKECLFIGDINYKKYTLTFKYNFEVEWRKPKNIYLSGINNLSTNIVNLDANSNTVTLVVKTMFNVQGYYYWNYDFGRYTFSSNIPVYAYLNKIERLWKITREFLQTTTLNSLYVTLVNPIKEDQLTNVNFNYYNSEKFSLHNYNLKTTTKSKKMLVQVNQTFDFWNKTGLANLHLGGRCEAEDGDADDKPYLIMENSTLQNAKLKFTRPRPASKGDNKVEIISKDYEIRDIKKIRFDVTDKCTYPSPTLRQVYFCIPSLFGVDPDCQDENNEISFPRLYDGQHYAQMNVVFKASFQYEYRLRAIWDSDEERIYDGDDEVIIIPHIKYFKTDKYDEIYPELLLIDYDMSLYPTVFHYKEGLTSVTTSVDLISSEVRDLVKREMTCKMTDNYCQVSCINSEVNNSTLTCTYTFRALSNYKDVSVFFKGGTCEKLLYIIKPELNECSLVTDTNSVTLNIYSENNLGEFEIKMAKRDISNFNQINDNLRPQLDSYKTYSNIYVSNYKTNTQSTDVIIDSKLLSKDTTTYYYFLFIKESPNQFELDNAIIKKLGLIMKFFESDQTLVSQISDNIQGKFTFSNIFDKREINTLNIKRLDNKRCDRKFEEYTYDWTNNKEDLSLSQLSYKISLINQKEYGIFTPFYTTAHCPKVVFKGNAKVVIEKPDLDLTMTKVGIKECDKDKCCPFQMVHHIAYENSVFEFTNRYYLHSYDLPTKITLRDYRRNLIYTYDIYNKEDITISNKFSFRIPETDNIKPGNFFVSLSFACSDKEYKRNIDNILIYKNDIIFSKEGANRILDNYFFINYERKMKPFSFKFEKEIMIEQLKEAKEIVYKCNAVSQCTQNGCPAEDDCSTILSTKKLVIHEDYTISENGIIMNDYKNERFSKEKRVIIVTDIFCQSTEIGIKSKPNDPWPYIVSYDLNVCPYIPNTVTIKFPCNNYDINQINSISLIDNDQSSIIIEHSDITFDTDNFEIKFEVSVVDKAITIQSFEELSDSNYIIKLDKEIVNYNGCKTKKDKPNGYTLATYDYISNYDYFIFSQNMNNPTVDFKFYSEEHLKAAINNVFSKEGSQLNCKADQTDKLILNCTYLDTIANAKRIYFYINDKCPSYFDIVKLTIPADTCQYYTRPTKDIDFVLSFDSSLKEYEYPNRQFSISTQYYHDTYDKFESLVITKIEGVNYTYSFQFEPHNFTRWAKFSFIIEKNYTRGNEFINARYDIPGSHKIIGDFLIYGVKERILFAENAQLINSLLHRKRQVDEMHSMKLYYPNKSLLTELKECNSGDSENRNGNEEYMNCRADLKNIIQKTERYYLTIVDACFEESDINEDIYVKIIKESNYLNNIQKEMYQISSQHNVLFTYGRDFYDFTQNYPIKIELVHKGDYKSSNEYDITLNFNVIMKSKKVEVDITTGTKEGLFKVKTTYKDNSVEISDLDIYVGSHSLGFNDEERIKKYKYGETIYSVIINFNNSVFNIEQIKDIRIKDYIDNRPHPEYVFLPKAQFEAYGDKGIKVNFPKGLTLDRKINLVIDDYYYNGDLFVNLTYNPPTNFTLVNEVYLIDDQSKRIDITIYIQFENQNYVQNEKDNFYIKNCCGEQEFKQLTCEQYKGNYLRLKCSYVEDVQMLSPTNYIIQLGELEIKAQQRIIYINPSVISLYNNTFNFMSQRALYTHSNAELQFYIGDRNITINDFVCTTMHQSYLLFFRDIEKYCPGEGYFEFKVGLKVPYALEPTFIKKIWCSYSADIVNIPTILYSSKPEIQNFEVELNTRVSRGYISNIIFKRINGNEEFESRTCTYKYKDNVNLKFNCDIDLSNAIQGNYTVYIRYGNGEIDKSSLYPIKYMKTYRDIISISPKVIYSYKDNEVILTFKSTFNYELVSHIQLINSNGNENPVKLLLGNHLQNPVEYPIEIPKNVYETGYYIFKVYFVERDDTFISQVKLFILEKQVFVPLPQIVLKLNNVYTFKIKHVYTTVEIKEVRLCGRTFVYNNGISSYQGTFTQCDSLVPEYKIDIFDSYIKMDFEFKLITSLDSIYEITKLDSCLYYNLDQFEISLTSKSKTRINLNTLSIGFIKDNYILPLVKDNKENNELYKLFYIKPDAEQKKLLLEKDNWKLVISGESSLQNELYSTTVSFTDLGLPEYVVKEDQTMKFSNTKCKLSTPLEATFSRGNIQQSITFIDSTISGELTVSGKIPPFNNYGYYDFYIKGCSQSLGNVFVSNSLQDSTFTVEAEKTKIIQNIITIKSIDYYCKLISSFKINNLGYERGNQYYTLNNEFENKRIVNDVSLLSNPATSDLSFILEDSNVKYKHDIYNYQFEITEIVDKKGIKRYFNNKHLYYEGPEYQDHIQFLSNIHFISGNTKKNDIIYIPMILINDGSLDQLKIDNEKARCYDFTENDYLEYNIDKMSVNKYIKCQHIFSRIKILEFSYGNNPCSIESLYLASYKIEGPDCIILGQAELSRAPTIFTVVTPHIDKMLDITTKIGQNEATKKEVFSDNANIYTIIFTYDTLYDSSNYNYQVLLNNNENEYKPFILTPNPEEVPNIYKYIDMISIDGEIKPGQSDVELKVNLGSPISENDLPLLFLIYGNDNNDYIHSKSMKLNNNKQISVKFNMEYISTTDYTFGYVNKCDKKVSFSSSLTTAQDNRLYQVKYNYNPTSLTMMYKEPITNIDSTSIILEEVSTKVRKEYKLTKVSSTIMLAEIEKLIGIYAIYTKYGDTTIKEKQQIYLNSDKVIQLKDTNMTVFSGYSVNWLELKLNNEAFEGLLEAGYQKYINEGDEKIILNTEQLVSVIEPSDPTIIRLNTASIIFQNKFEYVFYIYDKSSGKSSYYNVTVIDNEIKFEFSKLFYKSADYTSGITFTASGITNMYYKDPLREYYTEIYSIGNNQYTYYPSQKEEIVLLYYSTDNGASKKPVAEKLYIYSAITDLIKFNTEKCVYSPINRYDFNIRVNQNVQKHSLKFMIGNFELTESNSYYEYSKDHTAIFKILDGTNELYSEAITFTNFNITSEPEINNNVLSFSYDSKCNINSLSIKSNNQEIALICENNICKCKLNDNNKFDLVYILLRGEAIGKFEIIPSINKATFYIEIPSLIYANVRTLIKISSDNFDLSNIQEIVFKHKDESSESITSFIKDYADIQLYVTLRSENDSLELIKIIDKKGNAITFSQQFIIYVKKFSIITDKFLNIADKKLKILLVSESIGQITINNAKTDKGLTFKGTVCTFNEYCYLDIIQNYDYSNLLGLSRLTINYNNNLNMTTDGYIIVRNENPYLVKIESNENLKNFNATYSQKMYDDYFTSNEVYVNLKTQSSEMKCNCKADGTEVVNIACPVSYYEGMNLKSSVMNKETIHNIAVLKCNSDEIIYNEKCMKCRNKDESKPLLYNGKCYSECPEGTYEKYDVCTETCDKYIQEGKCVDKCSEGYGLGSTLQTECYKCEIRDQIMSDGYCVSKCQDGLTYDKSKQGCIYNLIQKTESILKPKDFCLNGGEYIEANNISQCICKNDYVGYQCSFKKDEANIEGSKLFTSIFPYGIIGSDGKIQNTVNINYNSELLLKDIANLISLKRSNSFNPNNETTDKLYNQVKTDLEILSEQIRNNQLSDVSKENFLAIVTYGIEVSLSEARLRRLAESNKVEQFIGLAKEFHLISNENSKNEDVGVIKNSFGLFEVYKYKNNDISKYNLLQKLEVSPNTAKFAYVSFNNCNRPLTDNSNINILYSIDSRINVPFKKGLLVSGMSEADIDTCQLSFSYKTSCEGSLDNDNFFNQILREQYGDDIVNFNDPYDPFYNEVCYVTPSIFKYDFTLKKRFIDLYPSKIHMNFPGAETCSTKGDKCGEELTLNCVDNVEPVKELEISTFSKNVKNADYNIVTKCAGQISNYSKNVAFIFYTILMLLLFIGGTIYIIIDYLGKFDITNASKFQEDENILYDSVIYKQGAKTNDQKSNNIEMERKTNDENKSEGGESEKKETLPNEKNVSNAGDIPIHGNYNIEKKQSFISILFENIKKFHPASTIFYISLIFPIWLKIAFSISEILILFGFNSILFSDNYIEKRILSDNRNNLFYPLGKEFGRVILSIIISMVITFVARLISYVSEAKIMELYQNNEDKDVFNEFNKNMIPRRICSIIVLFSTVVGCWYYSTAFCYIYNKTQKGWFLGGLWSLIFAWLIFAPVYIALISFVQRKYKKSSDIMKRLILF